MLKECLDAEETTELILLTASGTGAMEAVVMNCLNENDKVLIIVGIGIRQGDRCLYRTLSELNDRQIIGKRYGIFTVKAAIFLGIFVLGTYIYPCAKLNVKRMRLGIGSRHYLCTEKLLYESRVGCTRKIKDTAAPYVIYQLQRLIVIEALQTRSNDRLVLVNTVEVNHNRRSRILLV